MSNFRLINPDCIFIHIPKTGGTSIRKGIWNSNYDGPVFGFIPDSWAGLFKFAFVRHPLQRFFSAWKMFTEGPTGDPQWAMPADARPVSIDEFVEIALDDSIIFDERRSTFEERIRHHTIPQTHEFNCLRLADYVARYENFEEEISAICKQVGLNIRQVPHIHKTSPAQWPNTICGAALKRVVDYYMQDFTLLGYEIPESSSDA